VLFSEIDKASLHTYQPPLEQAGYDVMVVSSADTVVVSKRIRPALIILQLDDSAMAGLALLRELRTQAETRGTAVITLMRFDDAHTREQIVRAGATAILIDPVKPPMLLRQMRRLLLRAHGGQHGSDSRHGAVVASSEGFGG
jgi:DNA-binding response OmpR family regulator